MSLDPIKIKGTHLFYSTNGTQFFIKGVGINLNTWSFLSSNGKGNCGELITPLRNLGVNAVYLQYLVDGVDYSQCMRQLAAANIYGLVDLTYYGSYLQLSAPPLVWDIPSLDKSTALVKTLSNNTNLLGFVIAARDVDLTPVQEALPFLKAAIGDIKVQANRISHRKIPLGIIQIDDTTNSGSIAQYLTCQTTLSSVDFWALDLSWCGPGHENLTSVYGNYSIPVFVGQNSCNNSNGYADIPLLYGSKLSSIFSGGFLRKLILQTLDDDSSGLIDTSRLNSTTLPSNATLFSRELAKVSPAVMDAAMYTPSYTVPSCPTTNSSWSAFSTLPPIVDTPDTSTICGCMQLSLDCVVPDTTSISTNTWQTLFSQNETAWVGVVANASTGNYGAYSVCNEFQRVSWVVNRIYLNSYEAGHSPECGEVISEAHQQEPQKPNSTTMCARAMGSAGPYGNLSFGNYFAQPTTFVATDRNLSPGAIAGIVVGILLALMVGSSAILLTGRQKKRQEGKSNTSPEGLEVAAEKFEVEGKSLGAELADTRRLELLVTETIIELPGSEGPQKAELHSDTTVADSDSPNRGQFPPIHDLALPVEGPRK